MLEYIWATFLTEFKAVAGSLGLDFGVQTTNSIHELTPLNIMQNR